MRRCPAGAVLCPVLTIGRRGFVIELLYSFYIILYTSGFKSEGRGATCDLFSFAMLEIARATSATTPDTKTQRPVGRISASQGLRSQYTRNHVHDRCLPGTKMEGVLKAGPLPVVAIFL